MKKRQRVFLCIAVITAFAIGFCIWQNNDLTVSNYEYITEKIGGIFNNYKIAQISDLHNKEFGKNQKRLLKKVRKEKPQIIVITGDLVDSRHTNVQAALAFVREAVKIAPVYYITGNHEHRLAEDTLDNLISGIEQCGVIVLGNRVEEVFYNGKESVYLIGLSGDNLHGNTLEKLAENLDDDKLHILLAHEPQYITRYHQPNMDFVFSGHAHGGQFRLPFIGGLAAPGQGLFPQYTAGLYAYGDVTMVVSRGLGNSVIPIRIFNRPEIVCVTLRTK